MRPHVASRGIFLVLVNGNNKKKERRKKGKKEEEREKKKEKERGGKMIKIDAVVAAANEGAVV
jgi:hypothetical protein